MQFVPTLYPDYHPDSPGGVQGGAGSGRSILAAPYDVRQLGPHMARLAQQTGIAAATLQATVAEFNQGTAQGQDPAFGRGGNAFNCYLADPNHRPNPCVAPIAGLYDVGNDRASIMGGNYPGAGITHGPNMTSGYITGNHLGNVMGKAG